MTGGGQVYDTVIVGAGFYGCALAGHLARTGRRVLVCETGKRPMERASAVNQARVHTGFHYPRSYATALRSLHNHERFAQEYARAVRRDFRMIYAIARHGTKVDARRFARMYEAMGAPIERAPAGDRALFSEELIEDAFACVEHAFDYAALRDEVLERLRGLPIEFRFGTRVERIERAPGGGLETVLGDDERVGSEHVFNITYSGLNALAHRSGLAPLPLKHELIEIALVDPPDALRSLAVTVMDGPFFSAMPFPARSLYSLTHVRFTPHVSWEDDERSPDAQRTADGLPRRTRWRHMAYDAGRYMPAMRDVRWRQSLFDIKTVPLRNERDDGRPILIHQSPELPGFTSVLGSKIDNVYDLFDALDAA